MLCGCKDGSVKLYSITKGEIIHDYGKVADIGVKSMAIVMNKKTLFLTDYVYNFYEFNIEEKKKMKNLDFTEAECCSVTNDDQFLIIGYKGTYYKYSLQTNQKESKWYSQNNDRV